MKSETRTLAWMAFKKYGLFVLVVLNITLFVVVARYISFLKQVNARLRADQLASVHRHSTELANARSLHNERMATMQRICKSGLDLLGNTCITHMTQQRESCATQQLAITRSFQRILNVCTERRTLLYNVLVRTTEALRYCQERSGSQPPDAPSYPDTDGTRSVPTK